MNNPDTAMKRWLTKHFSGDTFSYQAVFSLLIPVIIDQLFLVSFNFINTAMISSSGPAAISAVNMVGSINIFLVQFFTAIGLGGTVLISQYYGRKQYQMLGKICNGTLYGAVLVAIILSIIFLFTRNQLLSLLFGQADQLVLQDAQIYLVGILLSYPMQAIVEGTNGCLRGVGLTKNSLQLSLTMNAIYLGFNILFVSVLKMGIIGLTFSLNISRLCAAFFAIWMLLHHRSQLSLKTSQLKRIDFKTIKRVITVAIPFAAESLFFNGGKLIVQMIIVSLGTTMIASFAIANSWIQLSEIVPSAMGTALVPLVGQAIGKRNINDAKKIAKSFVLFGSIVFLVIDLTLLPLFSTGIRLFNPTTAMIPIVFKMFVIALVMHCLTWSSSFVLPAALRAAGDAKFTTTVSLLTMWIFRIGFGYLVGIVLGYGLIGIYIVMTLEWTIRGIIFQLRFNSKKWYQNELI